MVKARIAFVCMFPDWGHIIPLLKIARAAEDNGHCVMCYLPEAAMFLARRFAVPTTSVRLPHAAPQLTLARLSKRSLFYKAFNGYCHQTLFVDPPVIQSAVVAFPNLLQAIAEFTPDILVGDAHVLSSMYEALARMTGAIYVQNEASGTLASLYRRYVGVYGDTGASPLLMRSVEVAGRLFTPTHKVVYYLAHSRAWRTSRRAKRALAAVAASTRATLPITPKWTLRPGLSWLEIDQLGVSDPDPFRTANLPPLDTPPEPLPCELADWLSRSNKPVVYVSFGSMLSIPDSTAVKMAVAIRDLGCQAIWSTGTYTSPTFQELARDPDFYVTGHVPQAELLKHERVMCFVTHAGSASLAEAFVSGTPILCVPLGFDNGYNSWLAGRLGSSRRIWKHELGGVKFRLALQDLISTPEYRVRAEALATRISAAQASTAYSEFFASIL